MTRYIEAFSWTDSIEAFLKENIKESPLLNVCSGASYFGDVQLEKYYFPKDWFKANGSKVRGDMISLPFKDDAFGAVFSDPPWDASMKEVISTFCEEALRVAPILYLMSPWHWGSSGRTFEKAWIREFPGITNTIAIIKYHRKAESDIGGRR